MRHSISLFVGSYDSVCRTTEERRTLYKFYSAQDVYILAIAQPTKRSLFARLWALQYSFHVCILSALVLNCNESLI
jgi:hypothetical protein